MADDTAASKRVILLGASNLTRGVSVVFQTLRLMVGAPIDCYIAMGHGRSYGADSNVLGRTLPGITECGLWQAVDDAPAAETFALVTDIGNDIVYGRSVETIVTWVDSCLSRLMQLNARLIITRLPLASLMSLSDLRFRIAKTILFPRHRLDLGVAIDKARQIDEALVNLGERYDAHLIEPRGNWYGLDPVHIRSHLQARAWAEILASWAAEGIGEVRAQPSWRRWLKLRAPRSADWSLFGFRMSHEQPATRFADGSRVWLY